MNTDNQPSPGQFQRVVGQLRELLDAGTRGPWEAYARQWRFEGRPFDEWHIRTTWIHGQLRDKAGVLARSLHASDDENDRHGVWLSKEDAALIVAAVNALPALLDVVDAADAVMALRGTIGYSEKTRAYDSLSSVLHSLPNQGVQPAATEPAEQAGRGPLGCDELLDSEHLTEK